MRRTLSLLLALAVVSVLGGAAVATHAGPGEQVTVNGTVFQPTGAPASDAAVLLGSDEALTGRSPAELRAVAADGSRDLTVVETGHDGSFAVTVDWRRAEAAVAVSESGISDVVYVGREDATLDVQLRERRPQTVHAHLGAVVADERRAELYVSLVNSAATAVENLSVAVTALPDGWSVVEAETNGTYAPDSATLTWSSVAPGAEVDTTLVLSPPENAPPGEYTVALRAESDTHPVSVASETVEVLPEDTPGPTTTATAGGGEDTTPTPHPTTPVTETTSPPSTQETSGDPAADTTDASSTGDAGPGPGVLTALVAVVLAVWLLARR